MNRKDVDRMTSLEDRLQRWKLKTIRLRLTVTIPVQAIEVTEERPDFLDSGFEKTDVA
jgi:hypothetical protein